MLYITARDGKTYHWHVGEPIPAHALTGAVVKFQADGDELEMIVAAMKQSSDVISVEVWEKLDEIVSRKLSRNEVVSTLIDNELGRRYHDRRFPR